MLPKFRVTIYSQRKMSSSKTLPFRWLLLMLVLTCIIWVRSLNTELFDWDEHTFMVVAQDVIRGHLPYVHEFDNKPPGIFFLTAAFMQVFGQGILAMRILGATCVFLTALMVFLLLTRLTTRTFAGLTALCLILIFGHHTSSELPVAALTSAALWLTLRFKRSLWAIAGVGLLLSLATIIRTNMVILCIGFGLLFLSRLYFTRLPFPKWSVAAFVGAGLLPPAILVCIYTTTDNLDLFIRSVIAVPFYYSSSQMGQGNLLEIVAILLFYAAFLFICRNATQVASLVAKAENGIDAGLLKLTPGYLSSRLEKITLIIRHNRVSNDEPCDWIIVGTILIFSLLSVVANGVFYKHYMVVVVPPALVLVTMSLYSLRSITLRTTAIAGMSALVIAAAFVNLPAALHVMIHYRQVETSYSIRNMAKAILRDRKPGDLVWALQDQLVYVYLNQAPPSYGAAQPDNPLRLSVVVPLVKSGSEAPGEIDRLLQSRPAYIVTDVSAPIPLYMRGAPDHITGKDKVLSALLAKYYRPWKTDGNVLSYKRN